MKKFLIVSTALFVCVASLAQSKGDKYLAASISASFGSKDVKTYDGYTSASQSSPLTTSFTGQAEFGYFIADNVRLAMCIGVPFTSTPISKSGGTWLKSKTIGFQINPSAAYYVKMADHLYYTPEVGFSYGFGTYNEDLTLSTTYKANYSGWDIYANILALEFQVNPKFAIGVVVGAFAYSHVKIEDKSSSAYVRNNQFQFTLNSASLHARFYL